MNRCHAGHTCDVYEIFQWFVHLFLETMRDEYIESVYVPVLCSLQMIYRKGSLPVWLKLGPRDAIEFRICNWTTLHYRILWISRTAEEDAVAIIEALQCGANPNCMGKHQRASPLRESPTSLSMYSQYTFNNWLFALREVGDQAHSVFKTELEQGMLYETGWSSEASQKLVDWQAGKRADSIGEYCKFWERHLPYRLILQPAWIYSLEQIRTGGEPETTEWALLERSEGLYNGTCKSTELSDTRQELCSNSSSEVESADVDETTGKKRNFDPDRRILSALHARFHTKGQRILPVHTVTPRPPELDDGQDQSPAVVEFADRILDAWASLKNDDVVCMGCWLRTLLDIEPREVGYEGHCVDEDTHDDLDAGSKQENDRDADADTEDDSFSPFLIHS